MYDIHCHLIPGVDDGADNMEEAVQMAELAASGGTEGIVATPHCNIPGSYQNLWNQTLEKKIACLQNEFEKRGISVKVYPGQEIFISNGVTDLLKKKRLITINRSRYLLVEFDFRESVSSVCRKLTQIVFEGYVPIVAHPERYAFFSEQTDAEERVKEIGALLQVNKGSLKGRFGRAVTRVACRLLDKRMADFVASDGHSPYVRTPFLRDVHEIISEQYSMDYADYLIRYNPGRVLEDKQIYEF